MEKRRLLKDERETAELGAGVARVVRAGDVIGLWGGLGSGKTCLARGLISALLPAAEMIPSPSFTLVQPYPTQPVLWHIDLYRVREAGEIGELGLLEEGHEAALLIEWPERMGDALPAERLDIYLEPVDNFRRRLAVLTAHGESWEGRFDAL